MKHVYRARTLLVYSDEKSAVQAITKDTGSQVVAYLAVKGAKTLNRLEVDDE